MTRPPLIVLASLGAIAVPGLVFAATSAAGGAPLVGALFLLLPVSAYGCLRAMKYSRSALFISALGALAPLFVGVMMTWPEFAVGLPYMAGAIAIVSGLGGLLAPSARIWYAGGRARALLDC